MVQYNNTKLQLICADLESSPEQNEDPVSTEDPILTKRDFRKAILVMCVDRQEIDEVEEQLVQQRATAITVPESPHAEL